MCSGAYRAYQWLERLVGHCSRVEWRASAVRLAQLWSQGVEPAEMNDQPTHKQMQAHTLIRHIERTIKAPDRRQPRERLQPAQPATTMFCNSMCVKSFRKDAHSPMLALTNVRSLFDISIVNASFSVNSKSRVHSCGSTAGAYIAQNSLSPSLEHLCSPGPLPGRILQLIGVALPAHTNVRKKGIHKIPPKVVF